jgi:hypothetical protein
MRFPGSVKILISSVNKRAGLLYDRFAEHFGEDSPDTLVVMGESLKFTRRRSSEQEHRHLAAGRGL